MLAADLLRFGIIYFIFVMGFSQSFYIAFISYSEKKGDGEENTMGSPIESVILNFVMSLGTFGEIWESFKATDHRLAAKIQCFLFLSLVFVMLINSAFLGKLLRGLNMFKAKKS